MALARVLLEPNPFNFKYLLSLFPLSSSAVMARIVPTLPRLCRTDANRAISRTGNPEDCDRPGILMLTGLASLWKCAAGAGPCGPGLRLTVELLLPSVKMAESTSRDREKNE